MSWLPIQTLLPPPIPPPLPSDVKLLKINIPFGFGGLSSGLVTFASGLEGSCEQSPACSCPEGPGREAASQPALDLGGLGIC